MLRHIVRWSSLPVVVYALCWGTVPSTTAQDHDAETHVEAEADPHGESQGADDAHGAHEDAHGAHQVTNTNLLSFNPDLAIVTALVFLVLLAVLTKFAWRPISESLAQREQAIADNVANAAKQNEEAARLLADHESRLAGAADEVRKLLDDARRDADTQKQQILADAQAAAESEKQRAVQEIEVAKNGALRELAEKSVDTAVGMAGKIVQRQLSPDDHSSLISEALEHFPNKE